MRGTLYPIVAIASLMRRPVCSLGLSCRRRTWFIFLFGRTLRIRCFNLLIFCTHRSELTVVPLSKNSTNKILSLSQKTLAMTLPQRSAPWSFLARGRLMMPFHWLSFRQRVVMMNPGFITGNYSWHKSIFIFLTALEKLGTDVFSGCFVFDGENFLHPHCANFL
jgi:hypothetical protein